MGSAGFISSTVVYLLGSNVSFVVSFYWLLRSSGSYRLRPQCKSLVLLPNDRSGSASGAKRVGSKMQFGFRG